MQGYPWQRPGHINILETQAFQNYLAYLIGIPLQTPTRFLHGFDSRVAACVIAKGRSSSVKLNRICRRVAALLLFGDSHVLMLWTISAWNHSDAASRLLSDG